MVGDLKLLLLLNFFLYDIEVVFHVDFLDAVAVRTNEVVVMSILVELVALHAVGKLYGAEDSLVRQKLKLTIDRAQIGFD